MACFYLKKNFYQKHLNLFYIYHISLNHQTFNLLNYYFDKLMSYNLGLFLKFVNFKNIKKPTFMSIIERDDLELKEIEIWDIVVQWGIGQDKELEKDIF